MNNKSVLVLAGSGMSADSDLETFYTGKKILNKAEYIRFCSLESFQNNSEETWRYWFRLQNLYTESKPHHGYFELHRYLKNEAVPHYVVTTNCDGLFRKAGFEDILEIHGSLNYFACIDSCTPHSYPIQDFVSTPVCPNCNGSTRPAIYLFDDLGFSNPKTSSDHLKYVRWVKTLSATNLTVIEIGVGHTVKTLKRELAWLKRNFPNCQHLNINPYENTSPSSSYFKMTAKDFLNSDLLKHHLESESCKPVL